MSKLIKEANMEDCGNCRFWSKLRGEMEFGVCRRNVPAMAKVTRDDLELTDLWPMTFTEWWCGEFEPRSTPAEIDTHAQKGA